MPEACLDNNQTSNETKITEFVAISYENNPRDSCNRSNSIDVSYIPLVNRQFAWPTKSDNSLQYVQQPREICAGASFLSSTSLADRQRFCCCSGNNSESSCWRLKRRQIIWESAHASAQNRNEAVVETATATNATTSYAIKAANAPPPPPPRSSDTILLTTKNNEKFCSNITRHVNKISTSLPATPNLSQLRKPLLGGVQYQKLEAKIATKCKKAELAVADCQQHNWQMRAKCQRQRQQQQQTQKLQMSTSKLRAPTKLVSNQKQTPNQTQQMIIKRGVSSIVDAIDNNNESKHHINAVVRVIETPIQHVAKQEQHAATTISAQTQTDFYNDATINSRANGVKSVKSKSSKPIRKLCERCCEGAGSMSSNDCSRNKQRNAEVANYNVGDCYDYGCDYANVDADAYSGRFYRPSAESVSDELLSYRFVSDEEDITRRDTLYEKTNSNTTTATTKTKTFSKTLPASETFIDSSSLSSSRSLSDGRRSVPLKAKTYEERLARSTLLSTATATPPPSLSLCSLSSSTRISPTICCYTTEKPTSPPQTPTASVLYSATAIVQHTATSPIDIPTSVSPEAFHATDISTSVEVAKNSVAANNSLSNSLPVSSSVARCCLRDVSNPLKRRLIPTTNLPPPVPPKPKQSNAKHAGVEEAESNAEQFVQLTHDQIGFHQKVQKFEKEQTLIVPLTTSIAAATSTSTSSPVEYVTKIPQHFDFNNTQCQLSVTNSRLSSQSKSPEPCELFNCFGGKKKLTKHNCGSSSKHNGHTTESNECKESLSDNKVLKNENLKNFKNEIGLGSLNNLTYNANTLNDVIESDSIKVYDNFNCNFQKRSYASEQQLSVLTPVTAPETGYGTRPRTLRYDSYGRLKGTKLPTLHVTQQNKCETNKRNSSKEVGDKSDTEKTCELNNLKEGNESAIAILKSEPLPTRICVANSSVVNKLTPTLCRKLYATTATKSGKKTATATTPAINGQKNKQEPKELINGKSNETTSTINLTKTTPTEIINDLQLTSIFNDFKDKHGLYEINAKINQNKENINNNNNNNNNILSDNQNEIERTTNAATTIVTTPTSPVTLTLASLSTSLTNSIPSLASPLSSTSPILAYKTASFCFNKNNSPHIFIASSPWVNEQFNPLWLSNETIASQSSDAVSQRYCLDDQQSNCSDQTTIFHLDNDCCSTSVTSTSSSLPSSIAQQSHLNSNAEQTINQYQPTILQQKQQQQQQEQHLFRGPLILKRIPVIQTFGYIPTHSHSLGSGANVRENGEKEINMEKRRNTLERFQRLGFGRKSSPATAASTSSSAAATSSSSQQQESIAGSTRNRKSSEKSEKLRELTELLRGNRSSPTPPPIPPPRKPRNGTQSATNSFDKSDDAVIAATKTNSLVSHNENSATTTITITSAPAATAVSAMTQHLDDIMLMDQEELTLAERSGSPSILEKSPKHTCDPNGRRSASPRSSMVAAVTASIKPTASLPTTSTATATRFYDTLKPNASLSSFESLMLMMSGREKSKSPPPVADTEAVLVVDASSNIEAKHASSVTRTSIGSHIQKGIPFRSASFSQIDSASGKFKRSALSVLRDRLRRDKAVESTSPTNSVIGSEKLAPALPRKQECNAVTRAKTEPDWIYIPLKRTEMSINLNYGQDKSLEDVLESPDIIPEEDIFTTDTEQASSTIELRQEATASSVVASHAKMESLTDTIQSENDFIIDGDEPLPVSVELGNLKEATNELPIRQSETIPSNLATLVEEQIPLESPPDNFLQTATTCLIPVPVYECASQDWRLENPPQEWVEVAPEDFGSVPETMQPLISLEQCAVAEATTANASSELRTDNVPTISVSRSSEEVDDTSILRRKGDFEPTTAAVAHVERRQTSLDKGSESIKRYSHDDMEIDVERQRVGNSSFDAITTRHSTDERKRIDKSTRRKGMYIDNADWSDSPVGIPHGRSGLAIDISLATFNSIKPEDSPEECNIMYLNSPAADYSNRTPGSIYSFDLNTPDSECNKPPVWTKAPPLKNFSCHSSEEKDETQNANENGGNVVVVSKPPSLTRHNQSCPFLRTDSVSDNESERTPPPSRDRTSPSPALSDFDFKRYSKRPLRGPYGQMLEAEMKKPNKMHFEEILEDLRGETENATLSRRQRAATTTSSSRVGLHDDADSGSINSSSTNSRNIPQYSNSMRVRKTNTYLPVPAHTRAASTPSQMENISSNSILNSKSGGGSVDKINPYDKRYQSSFDNTTTATMHDKDSTDEKGTLGAIGSEISSSKQQKHNTHQNNYHTQREMKRAASEAPTTKTHHSKRSQSMSGAEKSASKLQQQHHHQQKHSLDVTSKSNKNATAATIKPSQELLAELLQGSSEKLISEQRQQMFADTRTHVVQEIFRNEQSYVEALQTIVNKYLKVLKSSENAGMIDTRTVDEIFFMVPDILEIHETFLAELKSRLDNWDAQQKVGDCFMETFSKLEVLEVYTSFVNNCNRAKNSIRTAKHQRPSFAKFLETTASKHKGKLTLDYLLIKPVQKFPNYELLFQRLIKHTDNDHPDQKHLQDALKLVHDILVHINCKEREILENGQREATLRELEGIVEGITDLIAPDRQFLLFDLVSMPSGQGARKERGFFLFNDLLVLTSIKKRSGTIRKPNTTTCPGTVASTLDTNKYKFLTKISLDCLEIIKPKDENLKRIMSEIDNLAGDCNKLQKITDITTTLRCPHQFLEDVIRELHRDLQRQLSERQTNDAQLNLLELSFNSPNGSQKLSIVFSKAEKRTQWEQTFNEAKQKLAVTLERHPIPEFLTSIPIRKTRAGLQFTCASATLSEKRDVWVCNSDGYVGQVCIMSLYPEPNVTSCNGVCNARILCVASVPAYTVSGNNTSGIEQRQRIPTPQHQSYTQQLRDYRKSISPNCQPTTTLGGSVGSTGSGGSIGSGGSGDKKSTSDSNNKSSDIQLDLNLSSSDDEADTAAAASAANIVGNSNHAERVPSPAPAIAANMSTKAVSTTHGHQDSNSEEGDSNQSTMWIGTEDGCIHVYNSTDNIRIKKNRIKIEHHSAVYSILYLANRVFVSLANGDICVYLRDGVGGWNTNSSHCLSIGTVTSPVTKLLNVHGKLWCSIQGIIKILDIETLLVVNQIQISSDSKPITNMTVSNNYVWISIQNSAHIKCFHSNSHQLITEVNLAPAVNKMLSNCDEIIRQHKAACLRVTSLLSCKDLIWIGTSAGVLLTIPAQGYDKLVTQGAAGAAAATNIVPTGIPHGHTGHVRFLTFVETISSTGSGNSDTVGDSGGAAGGSEYKSHGSSKRSSTKEKAETSNILIISGGDGYEDFRNSGANSLSEIAGREDSTNHLLIWQI